MSAMLFLSSTENLNFTEICQKKPLFEQLKNQVLVNSIFLTPYWKKIHPYLAPVNIWRPLTLNYYSEVLDQNHFSWARQQTPCVQCSDYPSMHTAEVINPIKYRKSQILPRTLTNQDEHHNMGNPLLSNAQKSLLVARCRGFGLQGEGFHVVDGRNC